MSYFSNKLKVEHFTENRERKVRLLEDFIYCSIELSRFVTVPKGFVSDGASVPKVLWWCFHPFGKYLEAAVIHDFFCKEKTISSVSAAKVFHEAMYVCKVKPYRVKPMYAAVRMFGPRFPAPQLASQ